VKWPNVLFTMSAIVPVQVAHTSCNPFVFEGATEAFPEEAVA